MFGFDLRRAGAVIPKNADATPVIFGDRAAIRRAILPADAVAYLE
jgi:hypothetical protein